MLGDDGTEPPQPTHVLYRCRRCGGDLAIAMPNPSNTIREAVAHRATLRAHDCDDGAQGVADLIGSGPGRWPAFEKAGAERE